MCVCVREKYLKSRYPEAVYLVGKAFSCAVFLPSLGWRTGLGPRTFLPQEIKSPCSLCQAYRLMWEHLFLFAAKFVLLLSAFIYIHGPPANPQLSLFQTPGRKGWGFLLPHKRGTHRPTGPHQLHRHEGHLQSTRGQGPLRKLPLLFFHLSKAHSGLDCVVFSLTTPAPRFRGQKCLDFCSGG